MAGMIDLVKRGEIPPTSTVLYAHLGGQPALNGYSSLFSRGRRSALHSKIPHHQSRKDVVGKYSFPRTLADR